MPTEEVSTRMIGDSYMAEPEDLVRLRKLSSARGASKSALIRRAIHLFLNREEKKKKGGSS